MYRTRTHRVARVTVTTAIVVTTLILFAYLAGDALGEFVTAVKHASDLLGSDAGDILGVRGQ